MKNDDHPLASDAGDLTELAKKIEALIAEYTGTDPEVDGRVAVAICFTLPEDYGEAHWVTNIPRDASIKLFKTTAEKMTAKTN